MGGVVARVANQACRVSQQTDGRIEIARHIVAGQTASGRPGTFVESAGGALPSVRLFQPLERPGSGTNRPAFVMKIATCLVICMGLTAGRDKDVGPGNLAKRVEPDALERQRDRVGSDQLRVAHVKRISIQCSCEGAHFPAGRNG